MQYKIPLFLLMGLLLVSLVQGVTYSTDRTDYYYNGSNYLASGLTAEDLDLNGDAQVDLAFTNTGGWTGEGGFWAYDNGQASLGSLSMFEDTQSRGTLIEVLNETFVGTIGFKQYVATGDTGSTMDIQDYDDSVDALVRIRTSTSTTKWACRGGAAHVICDGNIDINFDAWSEFIWNFTDGSNAYVYVDGELLHTYASFTGLKQVRFYTDYPSPNAYIDEFYIASGNRPVAGGGANTVGFVGNSVPDNARNNTQVDIVFNSSTGKGDFYFGTVNPPVIKFFDNVTTGTNGYTWTTNVSTEQVYYYYATDGDNTTQTAVRTWEYDLTAPNLYLRGDSDINLTATHDIYKGSLYINLTADGLSSTLDGFSLVIKDYDNQTLRYNNTNSSVADFTKNLSVTIPTTEWADKLYNITFMASDTHTNQKILDYDNKKIVNGLEFNTAEGNYIKITSEDPADFNTVKLIDRYTIEVDFTDGLEKKRTLYIHSDKKLKYHDTQYTAHFTMGEFYGANWVDFETTGFVDPGYSLKYIDDYTYEITFDKLKDKLTFNSIGGLNVNQVQYTYNKSFFVMTSVTNTPPTAVTTSNIVNYCTATGGQGEAVSFDWRLYINQTSIYSNGSNTSLSSGSAHALESIASSETVGGLNFTMSCRATTTAASNYTNWLNSTLLRVETFIVDNCSQANTTSLNFSIFNENDLKPLWANVVGTLNYSLSGEGGTYTYDLTNVNSFQTCIFPDNFNYTLYAYFQYEQTDDAGKLERYYIENATINSNMQTVNLYNFNDTTGLSELNAISLSYYYSAFTNIIGKLQRYYPGENLWRTVQIDKTDDDGQLLFWVYQNTHDYKLVWENAGGLLDTTTPLKFICDSSTECEVTFTLQDPSSQDNYNGMGYSYNYNNNTGIVTFTWTDTNNLVSSVNLLVQQQASNQMIDICDTTVSSSSGTIVCNVSAYDGVITVRAIRTASPEDPFFHAIIEKITGKISDILQANGFKAEGVALSFLIALVAVGFGASTGSVIVVILGSLFGIIINFLLGLNDLISYAVLLGIMAVGAIVAYMTRR